MNKFKCFMNELAVHNAPGYHALKAKVSSEVLSDWFKNKGWKPHVNYFDFMKEFGPGVYFAGLLTIFDLEGGTALSIDSVTRCINNQGCCDLFAFGYDGTTDGCYCLRAEDEADAVYWWSWESASRSVVAKSFVSWVESLPLELYSEASYDGYRRLINVDEIQKIVAQRSAFQVNIFKYDKNLQRPPGHEDDYLPRYNMVELEILKRRSTTIEFLTVIIRRIGSRVKNDNMAYISIPVADIPEGIPTRRICYVFDPFNCPFESICVDFDPSIDLNSKMRANYKEIKHLLRKGK